MACKRRSERVSKRGITVGTLGLWALVSLTGLGAVSCKKDDKPKLGQAPTAPQNPTELGEVVAEVDGVKITVGELQERINKQSPYIRARYTSLERKKEFLDNLIRFEVLAKEAKKRGLENDPEVVRTMKQVMIQKLMRDEFENRVKPEDVTEAEMQKFYEEHRADYNKPEEVRVSAIVIKDKAKAEKIAAEAKGPKGADAKGFRDLVLAHSEDEVSKARFGDLKYFPADTTEVPPEVVKAAFALEKTGDVAGPIATKSGHYIIKQQGRRKALSKSYDEVKRQIQNRLYREKRTKAMEDFVANLKSQSAIKVHDDKLAKVRIDTSGPGTGPGVAPGMPGEGLDDGHGHGGGGAPGTAPGTAPGAPGVAPGGAQPPPTPVPGNP